MRREVVAFLGFFERQKNLARRYWAWEVVWLVYSLVSVLSIGFLASGLGAMGRSAAFDLRQAQLYLLIGSVLWGYMSMVFAEIAYAIGWERWEGTIEHTFMAPVRRATHLLGICAFAMLYGLARTLLVLVVAELLFHLDFSHTDAASAVVVLVASTPALVGLALLAAVLPLLSPEKGEQMTVAVQGVILLVSGVYYPISVLPAPLQLLGRISPMTYMLDAIRRSFLEDQRVAQLAPELGLLLGMGLLLIPAGMVVFGRAERRAKRLGLLKRSG
ncbi:MAG: ABC transporter permease [Candidatus Dormibacteraeota bacterium]|nr:ABC transporter permease [Candidatus Dormibacteraeota bacterium]